MLDAIEAAQKSICLEIYIYAPSSIGEQVLAALVAAVKRGVRVRVLVDSVGSLNLPNDFWTPLREAGGEARFFNPLALRRFEIRDHRKLLVCDETAAFIGGFNVAPEYQGDGITNGWRDLGMCVDGAVVRELAISFDQMFALADFAHKLFPRLRRGTSKRSVKHPNVQLLLSGPSRGRNPFQRALRQDLARARNVQFIVPYFLPPRALRRALAKVVRRGGKAQLILPGKSDVAVSQLAARSLYRRLLKRHVEIFEYQPQILHAKLFVLDDIVYVGSSNLDPRSLGINYELMLRFENPKMATEARQIFSEVLERSDAVRSSDLKCRSLWTRLKQRWAHFLLTRIDPYIARQQWRALPD